jgi:hypothetical protein
LFERDETRQPIRLHDTRATFITIALANGRSEAWVQDRTGHRSSVMINRYRRAARTAAELGLGELAPLDRAIPELASALPSPVAPGPTAAREARTRATGGGSGKLETELETPGPTAHAVRPGPSAEIPCVLRLVAPPGLEPGRPFGPWILNWPVMVQWAPIQGMRERSGGRLATDRDRWSGTLAV